ncbi:hypothetical protein CCYA_CCYA10G2930 [Cyanidiococcus yangmingshanensis]|nr:hypothetical protein CCYA_CCYA10G2930 [Cyanidiococcus yangmingshanensis]
MLSSAISTAKQLKHSCRAISGCLLASFGGLLFGYHFSVFAALTTFRSFQDWFGSWPQSKQLLLGAYFVGVLIGCLHQKLLSWLVRSSNPTFLDCWRWLRLSAAFSVLGALFPSTIRQKRLLSGRFEGYAFAVLIGHRLLCGVGAGIANVVGPTVCMELAPTNRRGFFVFLYQFAVTLGILLGSVADLIFGHDDVHRQVDPMAGGAGVEKCGNFLRPLRFPIVPALVMLIGLYSWKLLPVSAASWEPKNMEMIESGERSMQKNERPSRGAVADDASAPESAKLARDLAGRGTELQLRERVNVERSAGSVRNRVSSINVNAAGSWKIECLLFFQNEHAWTCIMLQILQQLTGINAILIYAVQIFEQILSASVGSTRKLARLSAPLYGSVLISIVNVAATALAMGIIDRCSRRRLYLISTPLLALCHLILAWGTRTDNSSTLAAFCSCLALFNFVALFAVSHGSLAMLVTNELFVPEKRVVANAVSMLMNVVFTFLVSVGFPLMQSHVFGPAGAFVFFAVMMLLGEYWIWRCLPETKRAVAYGNFL